MPKALKTVAEVARAVPNARECLVQIRFGHSERWVKIAKKEVLDFLAFYDESDTAEKLDFPTDRIAELDGRILYIG